MAGEPAPAISITPADGLSDGDTVTVTGADMIPGETARVTQCVLNSTGIPSCFSLNPTAEFVVAGDGTFAITVDVRRIVAGISSELDCVTDPDGCRILVAGTKIPNPAPLTFDGSTRPPSDPSYVVIPSSGLADGDQVDVTLTDLLNDTGGYVVQQCVDVAGGASCVDLTSGVVADGAMSATVEVRRTLDAGDGTSRDCADPARRCYLRIDAEGQVVERLPIEFEEDN